MAKRKITIIIVTFNSANYIIKCLKSLTEAIPSDLRSRIIVLDNNSSDNTSLIVQKKISSLPNVDLINNKSNLGFSKAVNIGLKKTMSSDYVLLLNPDTVLNKLSIENLIKCAIKNNSGITGGSTFGDNGIENGSYFRFPNLSVGIFDFTNFRKFDKSDKWHKYFYYLDSGVKEKHCFPVDIVTGGYMLITSETIRKIGLFDEQYFMYLEDVDFCRRAKNARINIFHSNDSKITHYGGCSSNNKDKIRHSSWLISRKKYYLKYFNLIENVIIQSIFVIDDLYILVKKFLKG